MNILSDIYALIRNKQVTSEIKEDDLFVLGRSEEPKMTGVASPVPNKTIKAIKAEDLFSNGSNVGSGAKVFKDRILNLLRFRTLVSSDLSVTITENANEIDITVPGGGGGVTPYYGSFYSLTEQSLANTADIKAWEYEVTDLSYGVSIQPNLSARPTRITLANTGVYNIQFSTQLYNLGGGGSNSHIDVWLSKNGSTIPDSNTRVSVNTNSPYVVASWNFLVNATAGNYFEIMWNTNHTNNHIYYIAGAGSIPNTPSIILTVNRVG